MKDMLKNKFSLRNFYASGENAELPTKPYQVQIRRGGMKRLQTKRKNCSGKEVFQHVLTSIIKFYFKHKKLCIIALALCVVVIFYSFPHVAMAADPADADPQSLTKDINDIFNTIIQTCSMVLWPVIMMIGTLLDNELIFGGAMGERLLSIWVQIRNLVNIIFVLILLAIAVYNVIGLGEEGGLPLALKTALPRFVLALIAVNFSFVAARVVLDFTNVITGAVFALPTTAVEERVPISEAMNSTICGTASSATPMRPLCCEGDKLNERCQSFFSRLDRSNITVAYAVRFGRAPQLKFIRDGLKDIGQLGFNIIFNAVLFAAYAISFVVLFLVLLFRVIVLWVSVVLSPLIALGIVLPNLKQLAGEAGGLQEKFIANAIAPIKIGLVLSIGYIMLDGFQADKSIEPTLSSIPIDALDPNAIPTDITDLQQLMVAVAIVAIIWIGVFAGTEKTAAKGVTDIIKNYAGGFGKWVAKLPLYAQIIPVKGKKEKETIAQFWDRLSYMKSKWTEDRSMAPERKGDTAMQQRMLDRFAQEGKPKEFAETLRPSSGGILATDAGLKALKILARKSTDDKDRALVTALGNDPNDHEKIASALYEGAAGPIAAAIKQVLPNKANMLTAMRQAGAPPGAGPEAAAGAEAPGGAPISSKDDVIAALKDTGKTSAFLAGKGAFADLNEGQIEQLRKLNVANETIADSIIKITGNKIEKSTLDKITPAINLMTKFTNHKTDATLHDEVRAAIQDAVSAGIGAVVIQQAINSTLSDGVKPQAVALLNGSQSPPAAPR